MFEEAHTISYKLHMTVDDCTKFSSIGLGEELVRGEVKDICSFGPFVCNFGLLCLVRLYCLLKQLPKCGHEELLKTWTRLDIHYSEFG